MPQHVSATDVVLLTKAKVQYRNLNWSLISHVSTSIRTYAAKKIPSLPGTAQIALKPGPKRDGYMPKPEEHRYISYFYHRFDKSDVPDDQQFNARAEQALNVRDKFSLLQNVEDGRFYDLIVQVVREPHDTGLGKLTLYVSDYTENPGFFDKPWEGSEELDSRSGDPYGYTSNEGITPKDWAGPYGKKSMQITCYEPHASVISTVEAVGHWVRLRNVQVKYGHDGRFLEGFMREDRGAAATRVNVEFLEITDPETIDPRLKEAIRRCRDFQKEKKKRTGELLAAKAAGQKRKALLEQSDSSLNSKQRRKLRRAAEKQAAEKQKAQQDCQVSEKLRLDLNDQVEHEAHPVPFTTIETILEPKIYETVEDGKKISLVVPFSNHKYRSCVRVVDFYPPSLEEFARGRIQSDFDVLTDNESGSDELSSQDLEGEASGGGRLIWEWGFALQLEDATPPETAGKNKNRDPKPRLWAFVNNAEAQCLTGLHATDLHRDQATLEMLRERMAILWGDLEAKKTAAKLDKGKGKQSVRRPLEKPPIETSDTEDVDVEEPVSNKPFACCIEEYGVKDEEVGDGWVRCFGLFGTKIR
jgi:hypothetical protein